MPGQLDFERDAEGRIVRLVSRQGGQRGRAPRLGADGQPMTQPPRLTLSPAKLDAYVGRYQLGPGAILTIRREGEQLVAQTSSQQTPAAMYAETPDRFEFESLDVTLEFVRGPAGEVVAVDTQLGPTTTRAKRLNEATATGR